MKSNKQQGDQGTPAPHAIEGAIAAATHEQLQGAINTFSSYENAEEKLDLLLLLTAMYHGDDNLRFSIVTDAYEALATRLDSFDNFVDDEMLKRLNHWQSEAQAGKDGAE